MDIAIHRISDYPLDNAIGFPNTYPLVMIYLAAVVQKADSAIPGWSRILIHWIAIYPVDSASIQLFNTQGLMDNAIHRMRDWDGFPNA